MPTTQEQWANSVGWMPTALGGGSVTLALSGADGNTWLAMSFVAPEGLTLSKVRACISALAGSGTITCTCELYSNSTSGVPDASIETATGNPTLTFSGYTAAVQEWTGFTTLLTAGTRYWIVFKNTTATPATNFPTFRFGGVATGIQALMANTALWGFAKCHTTDGSAWTGSVVANVIGLRVEFSDGGNIRYMGVPSLTITTATIAAVGVYAAREYGVKFTTPANALLAVRGVSMYAGYIAAAASLGSLRYRLYTGDTLTATTALIPVGAFSTNRFWRAAYFATMQTLLPSTTYRIVLGTDGGGDSSNYYRTSSNGIANDANDKALFPWSMQSCYFNSTWDDSVTTEMIPWALLLDTDAEFGAPEFPAANKVKLGAGAFGWNNEYTPDYYAPNLDSNPGVEDAAAVLSTAHYGEANAVVGTGSGGGGRPEFRGANL